MATDAPALLPRVSATRARPSIGRIVLTGLVVGWFALLILVPTAAIAREAFAEGVRPLVASLAKPEALRAFRMTLITTLCATVANTIFGVAFAVVLVRHK